MELGTVSAIITFAITLDEQAQTYYAQAQVSTNDAKILEALENMQKRHLKRIKQLQRFRRELVTEMILEPIHEFNREDFTIDIQIMPNMESTEIITALLINEENMKNYLLTASQKLTFLPELRDQFQRLSEDVESNIQILKDIQ